MHWRERDIRRRIAAWRAWMSDWWRHGMLSRQARDLTAIRHRVDEFRRLSLIERVMLDPSKFGDLSDQSFLLGLVDERDRQIAHWTKAPTAASPAQPGSITTATWVDEANR